MHPESMFDEVLDSMSEDEALNAKIEAFRSIKNPDRIQKARLHGLLMEQKARQNAQAPLSCGDEGASLADQREQPADPVLCPQQPAEPALADAPVDAGAMKAPAPTHTTSVPDENPASQEAGPYVDTPPVFDKEVQKDDALPAAEEEQPESPEVPSFFHSDLQYNDLPVEQVISMARQAEKWEGDSQRPVSSFGHAANFQSGPKPAPAGKKENAGSQLDQMGPSLKHVYVDPHTGKEWPAAQDDVLNAKALAQTFQEAPVAAYDENGNPVVYEEDLDAYPQAAYMPDNYVPQAKSHGVLKVMMILLVVLIVGGGIGFGGWVYMDYMSPENVAYREFLVQAENFSADAEHLSEADMDGILTMADRYAALDAAQQHEIDSVLQKNTGKDFNGLVDQVRITRRKGELESQIAQLSSQIDGYSDQMAQTTASMKEAQVQYDEAAKAASQAKKDAEKAAKKVESQNTQIEKTQAVIADTQSDIAALQQEIAEMEGTSMQEDTEEDEDDVPGYSTNDLFGGFRLSMKKRNLEQKQASLTAAQESLEKLQSELYQYQVEAQETQNIYQEQQALADQLAAALEQMQTNYDDLNQSMEAARTSLDSLQQELETL